MTTADLEPTTPRERSDDDTDLDAVPDAANPDAAAAAAPPPVPPLPVLEERSPEDLAPPLPPRPADPALSDLGLDEPEPEPAPAVVPVTTGSTRSEIRAARRATTASGRIALGWVEEEVVATGSQPIVGYRPDLLQKRPRRSPLRAGIVVPILVILALVGGYAATTLLWPLYAVAPTVAAVEIPAPVAPASAPAWPAQGSAAEAVRGIGDTAASSGDASSMASITKVVTALVVLDALPLNVGDPGPSYKFTANDRADYYRYLARGESAHDVPVGGSLSEYQMLQGMLIGSANNYADRLARSIWPTDAVYASAANGWLRAHGVDGVTVVEPSGFDARNVANPGALITLAQKALANPVIAEIVATKSVDLPGAGHIDNTNDLLADPGVIGVKTGTLNGYDLLTAKDITVADTPVRLYASVLTQADDEARDAASRALFAQMEAELNAKQVVPAGTAAGTITTMWGAPVTAVTAADTSVILWNGATGTLTTHFSFDDQRDTGDKVGTVSLKGPLDDDVVDVKLAADIEPPSAWWRLTHPLQLFGLAD